MASVSAAEFICVPAVALAQAPTSLSNLSVRTSAGTASLNLS
jgi:hypothetical protein